MNGYYDDHVTIATSYRRAPAMQPIAPLVTSENDETYRYYAYSTCTPRTRSFLEEVDRRGGAHRINLIDNPDLNHDPKPNLNRNPGPEINTHFHYVGYGRL